MAIDLGPYKATGVYTFTGEELDELIGLVTEQARREGAEEMRERAEQFFEALLNAARRNTCLDKDGNLSPVDTKHIVSVNSATGENTSRRRYDLEVVDIIKLIRALPLEPE